MSIPSPTLQVQATALSEDGRGIAEHEGLEILVRDLLPGEVAEVEIEHRSQHHKRAWGIISQRVGEPSAERQSPACPAFGQCGGCAWQHLSYAAQLEQKRLRVQQALDTALSLGYEVPAPHAAPDPLHYRNKGKYVFASDEGIVRLGAYRVRSHEVVSTMGCQVVEACIDEAATRLCQIVQHHGLPIHSHDDQAAAESQLPGLRYAILRANQDQELLVTLVCTSTTDPQSMQGLADSIAEDPKVAGVVRCDNDLRSGALLTDALSTLSGEGSLRENVCGLPISLGPASFWQIHRTQAERAYQAIADALPKAEGGHLLELYSGTGGIAFALAQAGHKVLAVDKSEEAIGAAAQAAAAHGLSDLLEFRCADATELAPELFEGIGAVIVDPPRKGLGRKGVAQLVEAKPPRIVYLSCGPESLANDMAKLVAAGYQVESLQLFDFMPGTAQIECLAILALPGAG